MKCAYCGEEEGTERIMNPNWDDEESVWNVCIDCKETIKEQQKLTFGSILSGIPNVTEKTKGFNQEYGQKLINEANKKLEEIANKTKKPILNACIYKKKDGSYDSMSIEFKGDG